MTRLYMVASTFLLAFTFPSAYARPQAKPKPQPASATLERMPPAPDLDRLTGNPWMQKGIDALANVSANYSVSVSAKDPDTLAVRINQVHQGMSMAGWRFVSAEALQEQGTTARLLLTYRRAEL